VQIAEIFPAMKNAPENHLSGAHFCISTTDAYSKMA
jgi:hypothetical protein